MSQYSEMLGPRILVASLSRPGRETRRSKRYGTGWQYNSRSDHHSKVACWCILADLLFECAVLRKHVSDGRVVFGINHEMRDFETGRKKNLDLVVCTPGSKPRSTPRSLVDLVEAYEIVLEPLDIRRIAALPQILEGPVGAVHVALEAKACMTEHVKALPRLHDELNSSHAAIHGNAAVALAAGLLMVNFADEFVSTDRNKHDPAKYPLQVTKHDQPKATVRTIDKVREIPRRNRKGDAGFDAMGIVVVQGKNDGTPFALVTEEPAPQSADVFHYDQFIRRLSQRYTEAFEAI